MQSSGNDGVIYFSLGSMAKGHEMPLEAKVKSYFPFDYK